MGRPVESRLLSTSWQKRAYSLAGNLAKNPYRLAASVLVSGALELATAAIDIQCSDVVIWHWSPSWPVKPQMMHFVPGALSRLLNDPALELRALGVEGADVVFEWGLEWVLWPPLSCDGLFEVDGCGP